MSNSLPSRVFLTGGSGYVGGAVARALLDRGVSVVALVRSEASAARLPAGASPLVGDLRDPSAWQAAARACDAAVHAAFEYDAQGREAPDADAAAVAALLDSAGAGSPLRHVVHTSNAFLLGDHPAGVVDEHAPLEPERVARTPRLRTEATVLGRADVGAVVRVGMVYGEGAGGTLPHVFAALAAGDALPALAGRRTRWSLVHLRDLARLYVRVLETGARGAFHGVDGTPLPVADVVALAADALATTGVQAPPAPPDGAVGVFNAEHLGRLGADVAVLPTASRALGWTPQVPSFAAGAVDAARAWHALGAASTAR
jgi:nucleoside-diphosphate-sugar epimerase